MSVKKAKDHVKFIGKCIYCGTTSAALTDEHIIPFGLNGITILEKASCKVCNKVTSRFETKCLRGFAWHMRIALGFKTRRPKKVPKSFPLGITRSGIDSIIQVPIEDYLPVLPLPMYYAPYYLKTLGFQNAPEAMLTFNENSPEGKHFYGLQVSHFADPEELKSKFQADSIFVETSVDTFAFAQMLAKIAYGFFVAKYGVDALEENFLLPIIFGDGTSIGLYIGSTNDVLNPITSGEPHIDVDSYTRGESDAITMFRMQLFPYFHSPGYFVIVGRPKRAVLAST